MGRGGEEVKMGTKKGSKKKGSKKRCTG